MKKNQNTLLVFAGLFGILLLMVTLQGTRPASEAPATQDARQAALNDPNRAFPGLNADDIKAFSLLDPDAGVSLTFAREDMLWRLAEFDELVDAQAVEPLALTVAIMPYLQTVPDIPPENYAEYGLNEETGLLLSIVMMNEEEHALIIGNSTSDGKGHYALVDDRSEVYILDARPVAFLISNLGRVYLPPTLTPTLAPTVTPLP
jgi:hypothetical protein